jgi:serine/threonine protein kinase
VLKAVSRERLYTPEAVERFLREVRAAARLQHPNVVAAYAAFEAGDLLVLAMEYVAGPDLGQVVATNGPLPVATACRYVAQAAAGLQHAYQSGVAHRDVKPSNLLLQPAGPAGPTVKVCDFGLAKAITPGSGAADLTGAGMLLGTPEYIAPKQAADPATADHRADIYGLGCTLYYLLAGRPPFQAAGLLALLDAHRSRAAVPLDQVRGDVPPALAAVVGRMMAKLPAARYQTPAEVEQALHPFLIPPAPAAGAPLIRSAEPVVIPGPVRVRPAQTTETVVGNDMPVPNRTAYLNPEDFNPPKRKPKSVVKKKPDRPVKPVFNPVPWVAAGVAGLAVLMTAFGLALLYLRQPVEGALAEPPPPPPASPPPAVVTPAPAPPVARERDRLSSTEPTPPVVEPPVDAPKRPRATAPERYVPLFNDADLTGWQVAPADRRVWQVKDGKIGGLVRDDRSSYLTSAREFGDFSLRFKARAGRESTVGVFVRATAEDVHHTAKGYKVTLATGSAGNPGTLLYKTREVPARGRGPAAGEWATYEVVARGNQVWVMIDGREVVTHTDPGRTFARGRVAFQVSGRNSGVELEQVEVKEFPCSRVRSRSSRWPPGRSRRTAGSARRWLGRGRAG